MLAQIRILALSLSDKRDSLIWPTFYDTLFYAVQVSSDSINSFCLPAATVSIHICQSCKRNSVVKLKDHFPTQQNRTYWQVCRKIKLKQRFLSHVSSLSRLLLKIWLLTLPLTLLSQFYIKGSGVCNSRDMNAVIPDIPNSFGTKYLGYLTQPYSWPVNIWPCQTMNNLVNNYRLQRKDIILLSGYRFTKLLTTLIRTLCIHNIVVIY